MLWTVVLSHTSTWHLEPRSTEVSYSVAALYCFSTVEDVEALKKVLYSQCLKFEIIGTLLLASEGINGTIACYGTVYTFGGKKKRSNDFKFKALRIKDLF